MRRIARLFPAIVCLFCILLACFAYGKKSEKPSDNFNGFYVGLAAGPAFFTSQATLNTTYDYFNAPEGNIPPPDTCPPDCGDGIFGTNHTVTNTQFADDANGGSGGRLSVGFGGCIGNCWYLGVELSGLIMDGNLIAETSGTELVYEGIVDGGEATLFYQNQVKAKMGGGAAFDIKTGFFLTEQLLLYGRAGLVMIDIELISLMKLESSDPAFVAGQTDQEVSEDHTASTIQVGIGLEQMLTPQAGLVFEYTYADYGNFAIDQDATSYVIETVDVGLATGLMTSNTSLNIVQQTLWMGLNYHF